MYEYVALSVVFDPAGRDGTRHIVVHGPYVRPEHARAEHDAILARLNRTYTGSFMRVMAVTESADIMDTFQDLVTDIARTHQVVVH